MQKVRLTMKKLTTTLATLLVSHNLALACLCSTEINEAFNGVKDYVVDDLYKPQKSKVEDITAVLKENIKKIETQNEELEKLIEVEKKKALQYENMIFLLKQKIQMLE